MSLKKAHLGTTLVELMVALTIGVFILLALSTAYVQSSKARDENERTNRQIESGRYAMQVIAADLEQAGYYGDFNPDASGTTSTVISAPTAVPNPCVNTAANLLAAVPMPVQGYDSLTAGSSSIPTCINDYKAGTDILVLRRASSCVLGPPARAGSSSGAGTAATAASSGCDALAANDYLIQTSRCSTDTAAGNYIKIDNTNTTTTDNSSLTLLDLDCKTPAPYRRYLVRIYYVANDDKSGDGIPTLKRAELLAGNPGSFSSSPIAEGIENMQIEYGIDNVPAGFGDGIPDVYTANPGSYGGCSGAGCVTNWQEVVTANIHVISRSNVPNPNYTDNKVYNLGLLADGVTSNTQSFNDHYERHLYVATVRLYNTSGRRETQ